jgi:hypothetical protein
MKRSIGKIGVSTLFVLVWLGTVSLQSSPRAPQEGKDSQTDSEKPAKKNETTQLHVVVISAQNNKPIKAAQVDVTSTDEDLKFSKTVRTGNDGVIDLIVPRGNMLIQAIADHFDTNGEVRNLQAEKERVEIKLH